MIRHQLPAYSPLSAGKLIGAALRSTLEPDRGRHALARMLGEAFRADRVVLSESGTHALQAALMLATNGLPDSPALVALPAYTCYDIATAAVGAGVKVIFYDIDPATLCPDGDGIRRALAEGARVVVAGNLYGFPLDWTSLRDQCEAAGALLVEDAAQAVGSEWRGTAGGSFGDLTVLSFGRGKGWTGGGGGALLLRKRCFERPGFAGALDAIHLRPPGPGHNLRTFVLSMAQWALGRPMLYGIPSAVPGLGLGETHYKPPTTPAAIGAFAAAATLDHTTMARREILARRRAAALWRERLDVDPNLRRYLGRAPEPEPGGVSGYLRFPVILAAGHGASDALERIRGRALGFAPGYPSTLPQLPVMSALGALDTLVSRTPTPGAEELASRLLTLPTHSKVTGADILRGGEALRALASSTRPPPTCSLS